MKTPQILPLHLAALSKTFLDSCLILTRVREHRIQPAKTEGMKTAARLGSHIIREFLLHFGESHQQPPFSKAPRRPQIYFWEKEMLCFTQTNESSD